VTQKKQLFFIFFYKCRKSGTYEAKKIAEIAKNLKIGVNFERFKGENSIN
jgi:hypothetical protein